MTRQEISGHWACFDFAANLNERISIFGRIGKEPLKIEWNDSGFTARGTGAISEEWIGGLYRTKRSEFFVGLQGQSASLDLASPNLASLFSSLGPEARLAANARQSAAVIGWRQEIGRRDKLTIVVSSDKSRGHVDIESLTNMSFLRHPLSTSGLGARLTWKRRASPGWSEELAVDFGRQTGHDPVLREYGPVGRTSTSQATSSIDYRAELGLRSGSRICFFGRYVDLGFASSGIIPDASDAGIGLTRDFLLSYYSNTVMRAYGAGVQYDKALGSNTLSFKYSATLSPIWSSAEYHINAFLVGLYDQSELSLRRLLIHELSMAYETPVKGGTLQFGVVQRVPFTNEARSGSVQTSDNPPPKTSVYGGLSVFASYRLRF